MIAIRAAAILALLLSGFTAAAAAAADDRPTPREQVVPEQANPAPPQHNRNDTGVFRPPPTGDEEAVKPAPPASKDPMPVITPPGAPGGKQNVQPK